MFLEFGKTGRQNTQMSLFSNLFTFSAYKFLYSTNNKFGSSKLYHNFFSKFKEYKLLVKSKLIDLNLYVVG